MIEISNSDLAKALRLLKKYASSPPRSIKEMEEQRKAKQLTKKLERKLHYDRKF